MPLTTLLAVLIFAGTYLVVAAGRLPGLRLDRAGAALLGASLMVACGVLTLEEAFAAIDLTTIALLLGMMLVVANLRLSGFFRLVAAVAMGKARHPALLLAAIILATGLLSAFLVNDAICLVMTPLVIEVARGLRRDPVPYLLGVAMASNVGSVATITGNPQNMMIGSFSHVSYAAFTAALAPVAAGGLVLTLLLLCLLNPAEFLNKERLAAVGARVRVHRWLVAKSLAVLGLMILFFFLGQPVAKVAILGGSVLLLTRIAKPAKVYAEVDWTLLVMFAGLFVVVAGLEHAVLTPGVLAGAGTLRLDNPWILTGLTAALSNIISNVPAVLVLKPFIDSLADPQRAWLVVAMASTLAGNLTLVGSVANLIVAQRAAAQGIEIGFWRYAAAGAPLTLLTLLLGTWLL